MLERELEAQLTRRVKSAGGLALKWACPGNAGVPDRIVLLPGGRVVFVEMKRPKGGRLSKLQAFWFERLQSFGIHYYIIWNQYDLDAFAEAELEAMPHAIYTLPPSTRRD